MEPGARMATKEALQDGATTMFMGSKADEDLLEQMDLSRLDRLAYRVGKRAVIRGFKRQLSLSCSSADHLFMSAAQSLDHLMDPAAADAGDKEGGAASKTATPLASPQPDPDKIFRTYPGFDPVFMKV